MNYPASILSNLLRKIQNIKTVTEENSNQIEVFDDPQKNSTTSSIENEKPAKSLGPRRTSTTSGTDTNSL